MPDSLQRLLAPDSLTSWEPALTQLYDLGDLDLDRLIAHWLSEAPFTELYLSERRARCTTYRTSLGSSQVSLPVLFRIYQRRNRLQRHHVEAFLGHLVRQDVPAGVLITTGGCSREAQRVVKAIRSHRIRLLTGNDWLAELKSQRHSALKRRGLWRWVVELSGGVPRRRKQ